MLRHLIVSLTLIPVTGLCSYAQEVNDSNTPLHLMQPQYDTPYGIPQEGSVSQTAKRVVSYLDGAMPYDVKDNKLPQGSFRLTSYEAGVLYSACLNSDDEATRQFAVNRMRTIATQSVKEAKIMATNKQHDAQMRMVLYPGALDDCGAMVAAYCRAYISADSKERKSYEPVIERYIDFVLNKQYRMNDGTFARKRPHFNTVWLDDMYMGVPAMAWYARYLKEKGETTRSQEIAAKALEQIRLFKDKMWVPEKKLFRHGWVEGMSSHPCYHWGRANGWAILTMCEVLDATEGIVSDADIAPVKELLRQHAEGLCALQDKTGFWHQLLDRQDTYLETSCTAIYTYCLAHAINKGWLDALTYGANTLLAWNACQTKVNAQGQVEGTCVGTGMGFEPAFYAYRPVHKMAAHGYGPMIWAGNEIVKMLHHTHPKMNDSAIHFYPTEQKTNEPIFYENTDAEVLW